MLAARPAMPQSQRTRLDSQVAELKHHPRAGPQDETLWRPGFAIPLPQLLRRWPRTRVDRERRPSNCYLLSRSRWRSALGLSLIHISEPTRLGMISYAVFCLKKKK